MTLQTGIAGALSPLLRFDNVVARVGRPVAGAVRFTLQPGKVVGISGLNGCGKTTLPRVIVGGRREEPPKLRLLLWRCWLAVAVSVWVTSAASQVLPPPRIEKPEPGRTWPDLRPGAPVAPSLTTPEPVLPAPALRLGDDASFSVQAFRITGATVFDQNRLAALCAPYLNRPITVADVEALRQKITRLYIEEGYVTSGAVVPDQTIADGVVTLNIIEGRLTEIQLGGRYRFRDDWAISRLQDEEGAPLNIRRLQERLQLFLQYPRIESINAALIPGARPGEAILRADVIEHSPYSAGFVFSNNRSPSLGPYHGEAFFSAANLVGWGDVLAIRGGLMEGLDEGSIGYDIALNARDTLLSFWAERSRSHVVEAPFDRIDLRGKNKTMEIGISHPIVRTLSDEVRLSGTLRRERSDTYLLGEHFSFSPGVVDGVAVISALRLSAVWSRRTLDEVIFARGSINHGLDILGATRNHDGSPDSRFNTFQLQGQWVKRLNDRGAQFLLRGDTQLSDSGLLPAEKFELGGIDSIRGYRENILLRDEGLFFSAEYRHPLLRGTLPFGQEQAVESRLFGTVFADWGSAREHKGVSETLYSAGVGARWEIGMTTSLVLYWAPLRKRLDLITNTLQDRGIHFQVSTQWNF